MTYYEAYRKTRTPQELIDMVRHDVAVCNTYGPNLERMNSIAMALTDASKDKGWNLKLIKMRLAQDGIKLPELTAPSIEPDLTDAPIGTKSLIQRDRVIEIVSKIMDSHISGSKSYPEELFKIKEELLDRIESMKGYYVSEIEP